MPVTTHLTISSINFSSVGTAKNTHIKARIADVITAVQSIKRLQYFNFPYSFKLFSMYLYKLRIMIVCKGKLS